MLTAASGDYARYSAGRIYLSLTGRAADRCSLKGASSNSALVNSFSLDTSIALENHENLHALTDITFLTAIASFVAGPTRAFGVISSRYLTSIVANIFCMHCQNLKRNMQIFRVIQATVFMDLYSVFLE